MKITKSQLKQIIKEELAIVLAEADETQTTKRTFRDRDTAIVNAWGGYMMKKDKESVRNLIKVLKSFNTPKEIAYKIFDAKTSEEVLAILRG